VENFATHATPAWGSKADFIIRVDLTPFGMSARSEQLWARKDGHTTFEVCCVPFFTYGISLGDRVETDAEYNVQTVSQKGGHRTLRVAVVDPNDQDKLHLKLHEWVEGTGLLYEWSSPGYLAVDLPPTRSVDVACLEQLQTEGKVSCEVDE
jgi:hypothetical protein